MLQRLLEAPARRADRCGSSRRQRLGAARPARDRGSWTAYGAVLYNLYGSTEASWASIATPDELRAAPGTAGRPPHGTRVAILYDRGTELPTGVIGRIFVGNDMLFEGYTNGTGRESHGGLLATGDLGHLTADGLLFVDGREDDMVISGGENVYPAAVEDVIAELPQVREVAVAGVPDEEWGQRLAAWIALHDGETSTRTRCGSTSGTGWPASPCRATCTSSPRCPATPPARSCAASSTPTDSRIQRQFRIDGRCR